MKKQSWIARLLSVMCALTLSDHVLASDTATQLVQACQSLKRQEDRNKCLEDAVKAVAQTAPVAVPIAPQPSAKDLAQSRFAKVLEAAQTIQSVTAAAPSYMGYQLYVQQFAIALGQYRKIVQLPEEKSAAELLGKTLQAYVDAETFWQADIDFYSRGNNRLVYAWALPAGLTGTGDILDLYNVPTSHADLLGIQRGATRDTALSTIWQYAQDSTDAAKDLIEKIGTPPVAEPAIVKIPPAPPIPPISDFDPPWVMVLSGAFAGKVYASPEDSSPSLSNLVVGTKVHAYAQPPGWVRISPKDAPPQWIPQSQMFFVCSANHKVRFWEAACE